MTLTELRYIVAVARERHFGRAAETCFVSQPTLSVAVKKLEDELGVTLFERGPGEVSVTPAGEQIVEQAQRVLEEASRIREIAAAGKDPLAGPLRLGAIYTIGPYLLPKLIPILRRTAPAMLLIQENFTHRLAEELKSGEVDVILIALPFEAPGVVTRAVYDEPFLVAVPKGHPWENRARDLRRAREREPAAAGRRPLLPRPGARDLPYGKGARAKPAREDGGRRLARDDPADGRRGRRGHGAPRDFHEYDRRRLRAHPHRAFRAAGADPARRPRLAQGLPRPEAIEALRKAIFACNLPR